MAADSYLACKALILRCENVLMLVTYINQSTVPTGSDHLVADPSGLVLLQASQVDSPKEP